MTNSRLSKMSVFERSMCELFVLEMSKADMTQAAIARKAGCGVDVIRSFVIQRSIPRYPTLLKIMDAFGLPFWAFIRAAEARAKQQQQPAVTT